MVVPVVRGVKKLVCQKQGLSLLEVMVFLGDLVIQRSDTFD